MSAPQLFDLKARRAAQPKDRDALIADLDNVIGRLHAFVASMPHKFLRESSLVEIERGMVEMQVLLSKIRPYVPALD